LFSSEIPSSFNLKANDSSFVKAEKMGKGLDINIKAETNNKKDSLNGIFT
jgi:hypothetical protein